MPSVSIHFCNRSVRLCQSSTSRSHSRMVSSICFNCCSFFLKSVAISSAWTFESSSRFPESWNWISFACVRSSSMAFCISTSSSWRTFNCTFLSSISTMRSVVSARTRSARAVVSARSCCWISSSNVIWFSSVSTRSLISRYAASWSLMAEIVFSSLFGNI